MNRASLVLVILAASVLCTGRPCAAGGVQTSTTETVELRIKQAMAIEEAGRSADAVALLRQIVAERPFSWPSNGAPYVPEWATYRPLGEMLLRAAPGSAEGDLYAGIGEAVDGDIAAAREHFALGTQADPQNPDLQYALGWATLRTGLTPFITPKEPAPLQEAIGCFSRALVLDPDHRKGLAAMGYTYIRLACTTNFQGGYKYPATIKAMRYLAVAARYLERLHALGGTSTDVDVQLADIFRQLGEPSGYVSHLRQAASKGYGWRIPASGFVYYDSGSTLLIRPVSEMRKMEQDSIVRGHSSPRTDPIWVASMLISSKNGGVFPVVRSHARTDAIHPAPPANQGVPGYTITREKNGRAAAVAVKLAGAPFAMVRLERPSGTWWYVTSFSFRGAEAVHSGQPWLQLRR